MTRRIPGWAYGAIVGLTFAAILGLGLLARQTLQDQASEESQRQQQEAIGRAERRGQLFFQELPLKLASAAYIPYPPKDETLPPLPIPDSEDNLLFFSAIANPDPTFAGSGGAAKAPATTRPEIRSLLLQALLDADISIKPFWYLVLARKALEGHDLETAESYCRRLQAWQSDFRLPSGLSTRMHATLYLAAILQLRKRFAESTQAIISAGFLAAPSKTLPSDPNDEGRRRPAIVSSAPGQGPSGDPFSGTSDPGLAKLAEDPWMRLLMWSWRHNPSGGYGSPLSPGPGWIQDGKDIWLFWGTKDQLKIAPGEMTLASLQESMQQAAGDRFRVVLSLTQPHDGLPITGISGVSFRAESVTPGNVGATPGRRLFLGFSFSLGLAGLAAMALFGVKRRQEEVVQEEREWLFRQAAHDLKTPISTIRALAETLSLKRLPNPEQEIKYLEKILQECDYSAELTDSILFEARLRSGALELAWEVFPLFEQVKAILDGFSSRLEGWKVTLDIPRDLDIKADIHLFKRVLLNLLENIARHAQAGKELSIDVQCGSPKFLVLRLGDRGPGFLPHLSDPQGAPSEPRPHTRTQTGLGLSFIRKILEMHGSQVDIQPREGGGMWVMTTWQRGKERE